MKRTLVWDLPVRLFHWVFAGSFLGAFVIANLVDDDAQAFTLHMLLGAVMVFALLLRFVWGFVGTRHARFSSFAASPAALVAYLRDAVTGGGRRYAGHNPGATWAVIAMFAFALGLGVTGVMMGQGSEAAEEVHELLAWGMLATVGVHLAGLVWHTIRHRELIAASMVDGRKVVEPSEGIRSARPVAGVVFLALTGLWGAALVNGYDPATSQVSLLGATIQVGEGEHGGEHHEHEEGDDD